MARTASSPILQLLRRFYTNPRAEDSPDQALLGRFLAGRDPAAFEALLRRHGPMVLDVCRGVLGNEADAEDAFQATFLVLTRKADSIRRTASLAAFLHGVARRTALRARADSARRRRHEMSAPQRDAATDPDDLTWREVRQAVHEEVARLPERYRAALVLCYLEGRTQDEAAALLGLPKGTLKGHLERGRALLRARLVRRGLGTGAVLLAGAWPAVSLSPTLLAATVQAATASGISPNVAALAEGMVKAMFVKKVRIAAALFLALAATGTGLALAMRAPPPDAGKPSEQSAPQERPRADPARPIRSLPGHKDRVTSVAYSPDGRWIATAGWDGTVRLWDAQTGKEVRRLDVVAPRDYHSAHLMQILFSHDSQFVVVAQQAGPNEPGVIVWDRRSGKKVRDFPGGYGSVALSPDGKQIACGGWGGMPDPNRGAIRLFALATGKPVRTLHTPYTHINLLAFTPDGQTIFARGGVPRPPLGGGMERLGLDPMEVHAWDLASGKERKAVLAGGAGGDRLAVSPDGRTLALANSLVEITTAKERIRLTGHKDLVCGFAFSPDGRTAATGSMDGTVRLWDLPSGKELARFGKLVDPFKGGWVLAVAFSPDGRTLVSAGLDKTAHVWDVSRITGRRRKTSERSPADLEADWKDLAKDATTAYAALGRLVSAPGSAAAFLGKQLESEKPVDAKRIERLIADLDDKQFQVRQRATRELEALADRAAPALRKALAGKPSLEVSKRLTALLDRLDRVGPSAETVRQIRAVEALEWIGTPEARRLLGKLAAGPPEMRLTQEARAALSRRRR